jgi:Protein of unknown function (DUF2934)
MREIPYGGTRYGGPVSEASQRNLQHDEEKTIMPASVSPTSRGSGRRQTVAPMHTIAVCHAAAIGWREEMIRHTAYMRSQRRASCAGKELEDWLAAEQEVDQLIACGGAPYG